MKKNEIHIAYDFETDFFVIFNKSKRKWQAGKYSFNQFEHDFIDSLVEIDKEHMLRITNGVLPELF